MRSDPYYVQKSILRSLLTDVNRLRPGTKGLGCDLVTLEARLEHEGIGFLSVALCNLGKAFDKGLSLGFITTPVGLKKAKGEVIPLLMRGIIGDVFHPITGILDKDRDCTEDVKILRQLLYFLEEAPDSRYSNCEVRVQGNKELHDV